MIKRDQREWGDLDYTIVAMIEHEGTIIVATKEGTIFRLVDDVLEPITYIGKRRAACQDDRTDESKE